MATKQFAINATMASSIPSNSSNQTAGSDPDRRSLYIRNYSTSLVTMWVAFGQPATAGTNGEMEVPPDFEYTFGGSLKPSTQTLPGSFYLPNCPHESINVITSSGVATGCVVTQ
jgi:hypothetical protein